MESKHAKRFELLSFYILTFALMTAGAAVSHFFNLSIFSPKNLSIPAFLLWFVMVFSPSISAVIITGINYGKKGLKELFSGFLMAKVSWVWYLAAVVLLLGPIGIILLLNLFKGVPLTGAGITASTLFTVFFYNFFSGPAAEEMGWRGFVLPRMLKRYSAITATLMQGVIWVAWHVPLAFVPDSSQVTAFWPVYATLILVINIILNWLWVNTKGSLLITVLAHFCFNFGSVLALGLLNMTSSMTYNIIGAVLGTLYLVLIFVLFKSKTFLPRRERMQLYKSAPSRGR